METIELLSPARNLKCAIAAINSGADAVYIGATYFGARKSAGNSLSDIKLLVKYAHIFNVKIYVTLNTILDDKELQEAKKLIDELYKIKVDAIIIQDFGILYLSAENKLSPIVLHMSTQCDIRNLKKVKFFEDIGAKRVVLAREMPLDEIAKISKNTNIELEYFVHGALCVSYSGQCYMSHFIGKRSANKGECAQACRKKYSLVDEKGNYILKNKYLLSLHDNNLSNHLDKLIKAGVKSFKIEGRLKDENYVKNVTLFYHNLLKKYPRQSYGEVIADFEPNIYKSFNRGFCDDYLFNKKDNIYNFLTPKSIGEYIGTIDCANDKNFTIKTKHKLYNQDGLCFEYKGELSGCLINSVEKIKDGYKVFPNKKIHLSKGQKIFRNIDVTFNKILENSHTTRKLKVEFDVYEDKIIVYDFRKNKAEISLNEVEFAENQEKMKENFIKSLSKSSDSPYLAQNINFKAEKLPFLPVSKINEIRRNLFERLSEKILERYKCKKQKPVNIAKFPYSEGDYRLNIHNNLAKEFYEMCGCKVNQMSFEYGETLKNCELMRTKHCLKRASVGCNSIQKLFLLDEKNVKYPLEFDCKNCEMAIMSPK